MEFHCISLKGERESNEDVVVVRKKKGGDEYMAAIFDGHGGGFASEYMGQHLLSALGKMGRTNDSGIAETVRGLHDNMAKQHPERVAECGSTVLVCRIQPEQRYIQAINLGDSRAVLREGDKTVIELTKDHKPNSKEERSRIKESGHQVKWDKEDRVYRVSGYSVSRAVGDTDGGGLGRDCDVTHITYSNEAKYLILACDGVWDVMTSKQACTFLDKTKLTKAGRQLVKASNETKNLAYRLAKEALARGSTDNISVLVILF